ncbi:hypothetical protein [Schaalia cardiffensis]|uniref:hypothetical protein n=1 Tax=Schaalia cardiffensis TaxID=181487 RepID=UPI001039B026|nr:hypothetical protein [Schaalia cardiffensis]
MSRDERLPSADRGDPFGFDSSFEEEVSRRFSALSKAAEEVSGRRKNLANQRSFKKRKNRTLRISLVRKEMTSHSTRR